MNFSNLGKPSTNANGDTCIFPCLTPAYAAQKAPWLDLNFDKDIGEDCVQLVQSNGCFQCHKPNPSKTCSQCKIAKYCSPACQRANWSDHRGQCKTYHKINQDKDFPRVVALRGGNFICDHVVSDALHERRRRYFKMIHDSPEMISPHTLGYKIAVVETLGKVALTVSQSSPIWMGFLMMKTLADGNDEAVLSLLRPGNGDLSLDIKAKPLTPSSRSERCWSAPTRWIFRTLCFILAEV